jgi:hypothetical protein
MRSFDVSRPANDAECRLDEVGRKAMLQAHYIKRRVITSRQIETTKAKHDQAVT